MYILPRNKWHNLSENEQEVFGFGTVSVVKS